MTSKPARNRPTPPAKLVPIVEDINTPGTQAQSIPKTAIRDAVPAQPSMTTNEAETSLTEGVKRPYTISLNARLVAESKRAVLVGAAQDDGPRSLSAFVEEALRRYLTERQDDLNGGERFTPFHGEMKRGRSL